jgi:hypothetical protein
MENFKVGDLTACSWYFTKQSMADILSLWEGESSSKSLKTESLVPDLLNPKLDSPEAMEADTLIPEFLKRAPDPDWIDIEMMGHWLATCDTEHGEGCRRPFGLDSSAIGRAILLM